MLTNTFLKLAGNYTQDKTLVNNLWLEIFTRYSEPNRHYHNIYHLENMLAQLEKIKEQIQDWDTVLFAVFYHDIVYDASSSTNEKDSADIARDRLSQLAYPSKIDKCVQMILATKTHESSNDNDTKFLLDADLSILGAPSQDYLAYTSQIREEFAIYPDFLYNNGRKKVLKHFLQMETIFKTDEFNSRYEEMARQNIASEIAFLDA